MNYYFGNITPEENTIFVFGSNPEGRHGAGSARVAKLYFGAKYGVGEGLCNNSYALPTTDLRIGKRPSIDVETITKNITKLYECAKANPNKVFKVAYRNQPNEKTLCGYTGREMINMFKNAGEIPENIHFSYEWYCNWDD